MRNRQTKLKQKLLNKKAKFIAKMKAKYGKEGK